MSDLENKRLKELGLDKTEIGQEVTVMDKETIIEKIEQLQLMPLGKFNETLLHPSDTVIDKKIIIKKISDCDTVDCEIIEIEFDILYNYIIGGFSTSSYFYTLQYTKPNNSARLKLKDRMIRRKGGVFLLNVQYIHHTTFCGKSYLASTIKRTPFSLMIPNYLALTGKNLSFEYILTFFKRIVEIQATLEPNLNDLEKLTQEFFQEGCTTDHSEDVCERYMNEESHDMDDCEYAHYESLASYCDDHCDEGRGYNLLSLMLTHPHFFGSMDNFCTGNQFSSNPVLQELQKFPNPITYIAQMIRLTNDVFLQDSYFKDRYMVDVFDNFNAFNIFHRSVSRIEEQSGYYEANYGIESLKTIDSSEYHSLTLDCFCVDCIIFRHWLNYGLKYDPSKLIFGNTIEVDKSKYIKVINYHLSAGNINDNDYSYLLTLSDMFMNNADFHFTGKSKFNQVDGACSSSDFILGMFRERKTNDIVLIDNGFINSRLEQYNEVLKLREKLRFIDENYFTVEEYKSIKKVIDSLDGLDNLPKKNSVEYLLDLYELII